MKIKFNRKELLSTIKKGGCFAGKSKVLPILECVKLTIKGDVCWILSFDDRNAIKTYCSVRCEEDSCEFCINKSDLETFLSLISDEDVVLDLDIVSHKVTIVTETGETVFPIEDANEYPLLKTDNAYSDIKVDAGLLAYWIKKGSPFLYNDQMQLNHENLHLFAKDKKLEVFCFGSTKMYYDHVDIDEDIETVISINRNSFSGFLYALDKQEFVTIKNGLKNILIKTEKVMLLVRKDEFKTLNYHMLLSYVPVFEFAIPKGRMLSILKRANSIHADKSPGLITFEYDDTGANIIAENFERTKSMKERIDGLDAGKAFTQTYGISQLEIAINAISSDKILLCPSIGGSSLCRIKNSEYETETTFVATYKNL